MIVRCGVAGSEGLAPALVGTPRREVRADGELLACEPATELPLAQRYFLY